MTAERNPRRPGHGEAPVVKQLRVPDIGDFKDVPIVEILVAVGDTVTKDQTVAVLESDKATVDIPSTEAGLIAELAVRVGDKVSAGSPLLTLRTDNDDLRANGAASAERAGAGVDIASTSTQVPFPTAVGPPAATISGGRIYAGPVVRKLAREFGVDLRNFPGTGPRGRVLAKDLQAYVRFAVAKETQRPGGAEASSQGAPFAVAAWPSLDFSKFGPIEPQPMSRIRKISGANLHRNWVMIPHVTNHEEADVTDLEAFRIEINREFERSGVKVSPLALIVKACVAALRSFPEFNASLQGDTLILKRYYHIGFATDTPNGLVVPVLRDADRKSVTELAREMSELAAKARAGSLSPKDMQGGSFSISSLGGIGGSHFTPIINAPEVAILGVGKMQTRVVWIDGGPKPRLVLPLSLSWDHRVVDGAAAGRFNAYLVKVLADLRCLLL
jgi:pyruvate dehydrogenase E2 component (dihydrolipoamide acetyltransferase)